MITKKNDLLNALKASRKDFKDTDEVFAGEFPKGKCTLVGIQDPRDWENDEQGTTGKWIPVTFDCKDGQHDISLNSIINATGLKWSTRNILKRAEILMGAVGTEFEYKGSKEKKGIRTRTTASGEKGSEYSVKVHSFVEQTVG